MAPLRAMVSAVVLVGALAGCVHSSPEPSESTSATGTPTLVVEENQAWRAGASGPLKILLVNVSAPSRATFSWQDILLDGPGGAPMAPSSAYEVRASNGSVGQGPAARTLAAGSSFLFEVHYHGNGSSEPTTGWYDAGSRVAFTLPPPVATSRAAAWANP